MYWHPQSYCFSCLVLAGYIVQSCRLKQIGWTSTIIQINEKKVSDHPLGRCYKYCTTWDCNATTKETVHLYCTTWIGHSTATNSLVDHYTSYKREAACFFSLIASWTAFRTDGINCLFVAMMPVSRSINLPWEKSRSFPAASVTIPPASVTTIDPAAWSHIFSL